MTDEQIALARRAIACEGWQWMPGMAIGCLILTSLDGLVVVPHGRVLAMRDDDGMQMVSASEYPYDNEGVPEYLWADLMHIPDLTDPATLGCLLALVRDAYGDSALYVRLSDTTRQSDGVRAWEVLGWISAERSRDGRGGSWRGWGYVSEAEALVAALEAAP